MIDYNDYIGIPYKLGGDSFDNTDCWGLVKMFYREELSIELPCFQSESIEPKHVHNAIIAGLEWQIADHVSEPQQFDIMLARRARLAHHVGIWTDKGVLHASAAAKSSVLDRPDDFIARTGGTIEFYRVKDFIL